MERGMRLDENAPGHGIGLAVVREICSAYGGGVEISTSPLGGARVKVRLVG
jgi:two-component system sensor histidine kinase PhoQ